MDNDVLRRHVTFAREEPASISGDEQAHPELPENIYENAS